MTDKLTKLNEDWLLCESGGWRGLISLNHINAIWKAAKPDTTKLSLAGDQAPMQVDAPIDDVVAIITGPPKPIDKPTN